MAHIRRILFALLVFAAAAYLFAWWRSRREDYGLLNLLRGEKPPGESFTSATGPKLNLDDVQLLDRLNQEFSKVAQAVLPSVVSVDTKTLVRGRPGWHPFFGLVQKNYVEPGLGSGVIVSKEGHVITNFHVIANVDQVQIVTNDKKTYPARFINGSKSRDIALLKIDSPRTDFPALSFANSDEVKVGQIVFAVGNPFGLSGTVTEGIVSARDRHLSDDAHDYLQTDTVINPGNSGGPLVNIRGEIVGINVAIYQGDERVRAWQGIGLAIPSNDVKAVMDAILDAGSKSKEPTAPGAGGYLGIRIAADAVTIDAGLGTSTIGAFVEHIEPGSPAESAGLQEGDIITQFDGRGLLSHADLPALIQRKAPGSKVRITFLRDGRVIQITATVGQGPENEP